MSELIKIQNTDGIPTVSSREVAEHFEKEHKNVLQSIKNLTAENSAVKNMFIESKYISSRGREEKEYLMTRDGFSLVVMGFTGKKALEWKLKYIEAFNKMENSLKQGIKANELKIKQDRATAMLLNAQSRMIKTLMSNTKDKNLSHIAIDVMGIKAVEQVTGQNMNQYLPESEKLYSAAEVGKMFGVSAAKIGRTANANGLKNDKYGKNVMSKSQYSTKEVTQFLYNDNGIKALECLLGYSATV